MNLPIQMLNRVPYSTFTFLKKNLGQAPELNGNYELVIRKVEYYNLVKAMKINLLIQINL